MRLMIEIKYLKNCEGASKFGNCVNCGAGSSEGQQMAWISFAPPNSGKYTTICLCRECRLKLASEILTNDAIRDALAELSKENMAGEENNHYDRNRIQRPENFYQRSNVRFAETSGKLSHSSDG